MKKPISSTSTVIFAGRQIVIPAGTNVKQYTGETIKRKTASVITVKKFEPARDGKTRVYWKSNGYLVSALIK